MSNCINITMSLFALLNISNIFNCIILSNQSSKETSDQEEGVNNMRPKRKSFDDDINSTHGPKKSKLESDLTKFRDSGTSLVESQNLANIFTRDCDLAENSIDSQKRVICESSDSDELKKKDTGEFQKSDYSSKHTFLSAHQNLLKQSFKGDDAEAQANESHAETLNNKDGTKQDQALSCDSSKTKTPISFQKERDESSNRGIQIIQKRTEQENLEHRRRLSGTTTIINGHEEGNRCNNFESSVRPNSIAVNELYSYSTPTSSNQLPLFYSNRKNVENIKHNQHFTVVTYNDQHPVTQDINNSTCNLFLQRNKRLLCESANYSHSPLELDVYYYPRKIFDLSYEISEPTLLTRLHSETLYPDSLDKIYSVLNSGCMTSDAITHGSNPVMSKLKIISSSLAHRSENNLSEIEKSVENKFFKFKSCNSHAKINVLYAKTMQRLFFEVIDTELQLRPIFWGLTVFLPELLFYLEYLQTMKCNSNTDLDKYKMLIQKEYSLIHTIVLEYDAYTKKQNEIDYLISHISKLRTTILDKLYNNVPNSLTYRLYAIAVKHNESLLYYILSNRAYNTLLFILAFTLDSSQSLDDLYLNPIDFDIIDYNSHEFFVNASINKDLGTQVMVTLALVIDYLEIKKKLDIEKTTRIAYIKPYEHFYVIFYDKGDKIEHKVYCLKAEDLYVELCDRIEQLLAYNI